MPLTHKQRTRIVDELKVIWTRRDMGFIPDPELGRMNDLTLSYLLRFWLHQDRTWDSLIPVPFTELPPYGAEFCPPPPRKEPTPAPHTLSVVPASNWRTFRGCGGGYPTPRQQIKKAHS